MLAKIEIFFRNMCAPISPAGGGLRGWKNRKTLKYNLPLHVIKNQDLNDEKTIIISINYL